MPFLVSILIVLSAGFYFYTYEMKGAGLSPHAVSSQETTILTRKAPKEITLQEINTIAGELNLDALQQSSQMGKLSANISYDYIKKIERLNERPGSTLKKSWLKNLLKMLNKAYNNPSSDLGIEIRQLSNDLRSIRAIESSSNN